MKYISTTDLRTKSSELVEDLEAGLSVKLIHRSKVVGVITPSKPEKKSKATDLKRFLEAARAAFPDKLTEKEREKRYQDHLEQKYGGTIS